MGLSRACVFDSDRHRNGLWTNLDVCMIRGGRMREAIIIGLFLILAIIAWKPRKGGRR